MGRGASQGAVSSSSTRNSLNNLQLSVLAGLNLVQKETQKGEVYSHEVSNRLDLSLGAVIQIFNRLEEKGLVQKQSSGAPTRIKWSITSEGEVVAPSSYALGLKKYMA